MGKRGPTAIQINWDEFDKLVSFQCTQEEIAAFFDISVDCLEQACERARGEKLSEVWAKKRLFGKVRLRKAQFAIAEGRGPGAATMAIYLDKKMLPNETPRDPPPALEPPPATGTVTFGPKSFEDFCEAARYPRPFPKQVEMMKFIVTPTEPRMLLGSRGYGKTDYGTEGGIAYDVYLDWMAGKLESTNLIISKSKARNAAMIKEIAHFLRSNGVPLEKENSTCIRVKGLIGQNHSVEVVTIKTSLRGRHPKRTVMDDPVTEEDVSEAMRLTVKKKYDEAYKLCKNICIIGQPAHAFDLYAELREQISLMEVPHGTIPELDADLVAMALAGVDKASIEMSYHLRIPKDGHSIFANLRSIDKFPTGDSVAFIDPSDGGDYTAITVMKGFMDGVAVYGCAWKKAWYHCLDDIVPILRAKNVGRLCFETNCTGTQPLLQLRELMNLHKLAIGVVGKHSSTDKHAAIQSAGSYSHLIHLAKESDRSYTDQVVKYEYRAKFDDAPDSLARCLEWIGLLKSKK